MSLIFLDDASSKPLDVLTAVTRFASRAALASAIAPSEPKTVLVEGAAPG